MLNPQSLLCTLILNLRPIPFCWSFSSGSYYRLMEMSDCLRIRKLTIRHFKKEKSLCLLSTYGQSGISLGRMNDPFASDLIVNLRPRLWTTDPSYCRLTFMLSSTYGRAAVDLWSAIIYLRLSYCLLTVELLSTYGLLIFRIASLMTIYGLTLKAMYECNIMG